jgi:hypothetical protein
LLCILLVCRPWSPDTFTEDEFRPTVVTRWLNKTHLQPYGCTSTGTLFDLDIVFMPVHLSNHWFLIVADMRHKIVSVVDSLAGHVPEARLCQLGGYLKMVLAQHLDENKAGFSRVKLTDPSEWPVRWVQAPCQACTALHLWEMQPIQFNILLAPMRDATHCRLDVLLALMGYVTYFVCKVLKRAMCLWHGPCGVSQPNSTCWT